MSRMTVLFVVMAFALCLDSLIKIDLGGFFLQPGLAFLVLIPFYYGRIKRYLPQDRSNSFLSDFVPIILIASIALHFVIAQDAVVYLKVAFYAIVAIFQFAVISKVHKQVDCNCSGGWH